MKNNSGITIITLVITIIVIVLIASITIYSGVNTLDSIRTKEAKDNANAIYMALIANEDIIPSDVESGKFISEVFNVSGEELSNEDFKLLGLDFSTDYCTVVFDKKFNDSENKLDYNFTYTNSLGQQYRNLVYSRFIERYKINTKVEFDNVMGVNRPMILDESMEPVGYDGIKKINNTYFEKWYNYEKNSSHLATAIYNGKTFVWIPRFAYKIQNFYLDKAYKGVPDTAIDIVFLREDTEYMSNNEVLQSGYVVHPAFSNGEVGFWVSTEVVSNTNSISNAIYDAKNLFIGNSFLIKNSEYAATVFLTKYLNNNQITFGVQEYVSAVCDGNMENADIYSTGMDKVNNIANIRGQAMLDTPWDLGEEPTLPDASLPYMVRNGVTSEGKSCGVFYYKAIGNSYNASYRVVLKK